MSLRLFLFLFTIIIVLGHYTKAPKYLGLHHAVSFLHLG